MCWKQEKRAGVRIWASLTRTKLHVFLGVCLHWLVPGAEWQSGPSGVFPVGRLVNEFAHNPTHIIPYVSEAYAAGLWPHRNCWHCLNSWQKSLRSTILQWKGSFTQYLYYLLTHYISDMVTLHIHLRSLPSIYWFLCSLCAGLVLLLLLLLLLLFVVVVVVVCRLSSNSRELEWARKLKLGLVIGNDVHQLY